MNLDRRHVSVRVAVERPREVREERAYLVMVAVGPWSWRTLAERYAELVLDQREAATSLAKMIHLRIPRGTDLSGMPSLRDKIPSRLRDALALAFSSSIPTIDLVIACTPGLLPWHLAHPKAMELLYHPLDRLQGAVVTFPDASGPPQLGREPASEVKRLASMTMAVREWSSLLTTNYQVGIVDLPAASDRRTFLAMQEVAGSDVALAGWEGDDGTMVRHGWRSAAAVAAGLLASSSMPTDSIVAKRVVLPGGRPFPPSRHAELGVPLRQHRLSTHALDAVIPVRISDDGTYAVLLDEPALRRPTGAWTLPMLRTVKLLHQRIVITANTFTFRNANEEQALLLHNALRMAVADFERRGILQGEHVGQPVSIQAVPYRNPTEPAIVAQVTAYMRPWLKRVRVGLTVRHGQPVAVELT